MADTKIALLPLKAVPDGTEEIPINDGGLDRHVLGSGILNVPHSPVLPEGAAPSTPAASHVILYAKADGLLYSKDDAGVETPLGGGGAEVWEDAGETWTYASVDDPTGVITVPSDATLKYSPGMRIRFVNGGNTIYGIITAVAATTITFLHQIDPTDSLALTLMANSAITLPYFSSAKAPFGFPLQRAKWTVKLVDTASNSWASPTADTWYNSTSLAIPIGSWVWSYQVSAGLRSTAAVDEIEQYATLSTANNSESDVNNTSHGFVTTSKVGTYNRLALQMYRDGVLDLASKTTYYLNLKYKVSTTVNTMYDYAGDSPSIIRAVCAYL